MKKTIEKVVATVVMIITMVASQFKKENSVKSVKEIIEFVKMINVLTIYLAKRFIDGVQLEDFTIFMDTLMNDDEFKGIMKDGYDNASEMKAEAKDADVGEWLEVAKVQVEFIPEFVSIFIEDEAEVVEA